jgi:hypothetical protein
MRRDEMIPAGPRAGLSTRTWRDWGPWAIALLVAALSLWLHMSVPIEAEGDNWWDERLFLDLAQYLINGQWLGYFGPQTLSKGPFYPLFIAANFLLGPPLRLTEQLIYLGSAAVLAVVMARLVGRWLAAGLFMVIACNPVQWAGLQRVLRENIYGSEALLLFALAARLYLVEAGAPLGRPLGGRAGWPLALGAAFAAYWLTREEGIWLLPSLGLMLLYWLAHRFIVWRRTDSRPRRWLLAEARYLALPVLVFLVATTAVDALNWKHYRVWRTNDFARSSSFIQAYGAITRIKTALPNPRYLFTAEARAQAYAVSPAARELEPLLEGDLSKGWILSTCPWSAPEDPLRCKELISGWLPWMIRDAADKLHYFETAPKAEAYFQRLADEINAACDSGRIACLPPRATLAPPVPAGWDWQPLLVERLQYAYWVLTTFGDGPIPLHPSVGQPHNLRAFEDLTGGPLAPVVSPGKGLFIRGRIMGTDDLAHINLIYRADIKRPTGPLYRTIEISPNPGERSTWDFFITSNCEPSDCVVKVGLPGAASIADLLVDKNTPLGTELLRSPSARLLIDQVGDAQDAGQWATRKLLRVQHKAMEYVEVAYARLMPKVALAAAVVFVLLVLMDLRRRRLSAVTVLATGLLGAALGRVAMLAWIDITSFHVLEVHYMAPAHPLLLAFCGLTLAAGVRAVVPAVRGLPGGWGKRLRRAA